MPRQPTFRINAKNIFITYPHCPLPKNEALQQIVDLPFPISPIYIRVAREAHQDGTPHLHCLVQFEGRFQTQNVRCFDLSSSSNVIYHPNVQGARSASAVNEYISKEDDYTDHGSFKGDQRQRSSVKDRSDVYAAVLACDDKGIALNIIRREDPKVFLLNFDKLDSNLNRIFVKPPTAYSSSFINFQNIPSDLTIWATDNIHPDDTRPHRPLSIIIEGPSRIGKTCWARSLGPHNYYSGHIDMARHKDEVHFNIIDDVPPVYLKHLKEFIGAQHDWTSNCKYAKPRLIKGRLGVLLWQLVYKLEKSIVVSWRIYYK
ncbi:hypothetical protein OROMI_006665 [Orobanche minor]